MHERGFELTRQHAIQAEAVPSLKAFETVSRVQDTPAILSEPSLFAIIMENFRGRISQSMVPHLKMDSSYKVDEGYSEETRSQDGLDSPTDMEQDGENLLQAQMLSARGLSTTVLALSEAEKAGMPIHGKVMRIISQLC